MTDRHRADPAQREPLTDQDLAIAALVGRYIERREHHESPRVIVQAVAVTLSGT